MSTIVAPNRVAPARRDTASPLAGFWRLAWKEYRAIRLFWLLVASVFVLAQWTTTTLVHNEPMTIELIFFSLAAPALFAVGAAGTAFAGEREEGTIEFLRAAPVSGSQVFTSKLLAVTVGAAAMFAAVAPSAMLCTHGRIAGELEWGSMLGLWLVSAIEAIAWGTLFSMTGSRPIVAVVLTLVAVSTCDHILAWANRGPTNQIFEWASYARAAPSRLLIAAFVFGFDAYLGRRWLAESSRIQNRGGLFRQHLAAGAPTESTSTATDDSGKLQSLALTRDRGAMFGRLLWQQWRQSRRVMLLMLILFLIISLPVIPMPFMAAIMGSLVFLPDQEQRRYRFFTEHDASPRMVWLARQLPWLATVTIAMLATLVLGYFNGTSVPWRTMNMEAFQYRTRPYANREPELGLAIAVTLVAFAGGQWVSMLMRSGILAAFSAAVLGGLLCGWALLMRVMHVNLAWSVLPVALVFIWATWLRAPDWITENRRWRARARAAGAVLIPATILVVAVAIFRVHQVLDVSPGFDVASYERQLQANLAEGIATAELYRQADYRLTKRTAIPETAPTLAYEERENARPPTPDDVRWLKRNTDVIPLVLEAVKRPNCVWDDPRTQQLWSYFSGGFPISELMLASARQMEGEGNLDGALDRYFATFNVISQTDVYLMPDFRRPFHQIAYWGAQKGQTPARIRRAIKGLDALDPRLLKLDYAIASTYLLGQRVAAGEPASLWLNRPGDSSVYSLWVEFMPWEKARALRVLNLLTAVAERRLQEMRTTLDLDDKGIDHLNVRGFARFCRSPFIDDELFSTRAWTGLRADDPKRNEWDWLETTVPDMSPMGYVGLQAATYFARFEAERRATIIVLAVEAYRLDHGALPHSLDELAPDYLPKVPLDPYSGFAFNYYPKGISPPRDSAEKHSLDRAAGYDGDDAGFPLEFNRPGIWSTGQRLTPLTEISNESDQSGDAAAHGALFVVGYQLRGQFTGSLAILPSYTAWGFGAWFGIPETSGGSMPLGGEITTGGSSIQEAVAP
jgi:hypothetical protein